MRNPWKDNERKKKNEGTNGKAAQGKIFLNGGIQKWYEITRIKIAPTFDCMKVTSCLYYKIE